MRRHDKSLIDGYAAMAEQAALWSGRAAGAAMVLICTLVLAEVFARNVLNRSTMIADEMCGYLNVATVFLGLAYTMQRRGFIRVELVYHRLRGAAKAFADWFNVAGSLFYAACMLFYMTKYVIYSYVNNITSAEITATPQYIPQLSVVVGSLVLTLYLIKFVLTRCRDVP